jgi:hypothetical protein
MLHHALGDLIIAEAFENEMTDKAGAVLVIEHVAFGGWAMALADADRGCAFERRAAEDECRLKEGALAAAVSAADVKGLHEASEEDQVSNMPPEILRRSHVV